MTKVQKQRGRPPGYPARKWAVLKMVADEFIGTTSDEFVMTHAVRRALHANGCLVNESTESDHARSFRKHKVGLVAEAQCRRTPPPRAQVPAFERSASVGQSKHSDHFGLMSMSALFKTHDPWKELSASLNFAAQHQAEMKKFHDALFPAVRLFKELTKPASEYRRLLDTIQAAGRPFRFGF